MHIMKLRKKNAKVLLIINVVLAELQLKKSNRKPKKSPKITETVTKHKQNQSF